MHLRVLRSPAVNFRRRWNDHINTNRLAPLFHTAIGGGCYFRGISFRGYRHFISYILYIYPYFVIVSQDSVQDSVVEVTFNFWYNFFAILLFFKIFFSFFFFLITIEPCFVGVCHLRFYFLYIIFLSNLKSLSRGFRAFKVAKWIINFWYNRRQGELFLLYRRFAFYG